MLGCIAAVVSTFSAAKGLVLGRRTNQRRGEKDPSRVGSCRDHDDPDRHNDGPENAKPTARFSPAKRRSAQLRPNSMQEMKRSYDDMKNEAKPESMVSVGQWRERVV